MAEHIGREAEKSDDHRREPVDRAATGRREGFVGTGVREGADLTKASRHSITASSCWSVTLEAAFPKSPGSRTLRQNYAPAFCKWRASYWNADNRVRVSPPMRQTDEAAGGRGREASPGVEYGKNRIKGENTALTNLVRAVNRPLRHEPCMTPQARNGASANVLGTNPVFTRVASSEQAECNANGT
jgi:hypothetical protein